MKKYLLFDLDGTLTDPGLGITVSVQYALHSFGIEEPDLDKLESFIGPPLRDSFMEFYGMSAEQAEEAVAKYRERFQDAGIFENEVYRGIPRMLRLLQANGMVLAVASSKPQVFVERILEHFDLRKYFTVVVGSELNGSRESKDEVVQEALSRLFCASSEESSAPRSRGAEFSSLLVQKTIRREQVYMIGDRRFDVEGARALQVESVGVTYGYGSMEELKEAKADYIVQSVGELEKFLMRGVEEEKEAAEGKKRTNMKRISIIFGSFFLFLLVRLLADGVFALLGCRGVLVTAVGFFAGGLAIGGTARSFIVRTAEETRLSHLRQEPKSAYVLSGVATAGAALGLNLLLELLRVTASSQEYQAVAAEQYAVPFWGGLFAFGLVSPIAEELLFRGIFYNCLRQAVSVKWALLISSALFGLYHMNYVQGIYGFLMGCLIAYFYEYYGKFGIAVAAHMGANLLVYCLAYSWDSLGVFVSWPVCAGFLAVTVVSLKMLSGRKKVL